MAPAHSAMRTMKLVAARPVVPVAPTDVLFVSCTTRATVSPSARLLIGPTVSPPWSPVGVASTTWT